MKQNISNFESLISPRACSGDIIINYIQTTFSASAFNKNARLLFDQERHDNYMIESMFQIKAGLVVLRVRCDV